MHISDFPKRSKSRKKTLDTLVDCTIVGVAHVSKNHIWCSWRQKGNFDPILMPYVFGETRLFIFEESSTQR